MTDARLLDNPQYRNRVDPSGLGTRISELPAQCRQAWQRAYALDTTNLYSDIKRVVIAGMGGSAIGGDLLSDLAHSIGEGPIQVWRDYELPPFVNSSTLVIVSSYSGNTEEALSSLRSGLEHLIPLVALTAGGDLGKEASKMGVPLLTVPFRGEPRLALGYSFIGPLALASKLGLVSISKDNLEAALYEVERDLGICTPDVPALINPAKTLASKLKGHLGIIYGGGYLSAVARRWKTQINENAKDWAFFEVLPELNHNSVVSYEQTTQGRNKIFVILLQPSMAHPRLQQRYLVTKELLQEYHIPHQVVAFNGSTALAQILHAALLGDWVSYYLALLNEVDPSPVPSIEFLKRRLVELRNP